MKFGAIYTGMNKEKAFLLAAYNGYLAVVEFVLSNGADIDAQYDTISRINKEYYQMVIASKPKTNNQCQTLTKKLTQCKK